jgi:DNA-binding MarR family transcriptional regulator
MAAGRPIGYWLKRADALLTQRIDEAQRANGLTRLEWQALNVVRDGGSTAERVAETLRPFADAELVTLTLAGLVGRHVVQSVGGRTFELTADGHALFARAAETQAEVRARAMNGISESDYATTIATLERLAANLDGGT